MSETTTAPTYTEIKILHEESTEARKRALEKEHTTQRAIADGLDEGLSATKLAHTLGLARSRVYALADAGRKQREES